MTTAVQEPRPQGSGLAKKLIALLFLAFTLAGATGCHRTEDDFDDRTLAKRPHVETVKPDDRKDIFRPSN